MLLGERLFEVSLLETILELPHKQFLVWRYDTYDNFVELGEVFPQWLRGTLSYLEQGDGHLSKMTSGKLVYKYLHQILIVGDGSSGKTHIPLQGCVPEGFIQQFSIQRVGHSNDGHLSIDGGDMFIRDNNSIKLYPRVKLELFRDMHFHLLWGMGLLLEMSYVEDIIL